jgi:hypothetical protein
MHRRARPLALLTALSLALALAGAGCAKRDASGAHGNAAATQGPAAAAGAPRDATKNGATASPRRQLLEIQASFELGLASGTSLQAASTPLVALVESRGGYVEESELGGGAQAQGRLVMRVPTAALGELRARLAQGGDVLRESQTAKDVTDAIADVDARRSSAAAEEARLLKLLDEKTGSLADVLAVEKALADVRERIERLDAEARVAKGRVELATVTIVLRPAAVSDADRAFADRLREAARDGLSTARDVVVGLTLLGLRAAPTLAVLGLLPALLLLAARRGRRTLGSGAQT